MKLIIGIGNPGEKYKNNRHNVGFMVVDKLAQMVNGQWSMNKRFQSLIINHQPLVILAKPTTFMNNSGIAVSVLTNFYHLVPSALFVIHDDLDIPLGSYKIQFGRGPKDHNGLNSIYEKLGTKNFWHVRVGIENRKMPNAKCQMLNGKKISGEEYVLQDFGDDEAKIVDKVIDEVTKELISKINGKLLQ